MNRIQRVKLTVSGRVQGVGYRWYACAAAQKRQLVGYVKNEIDGSVSLEVEGNATAIESLIVDLERGPSMASVSAVKSISIPVLKQETEFSIKSW